MSEAMSVVRGKTLETRVKSGVGIFSFRATVRHPDLSESVPECLAAEASQGDVDRYIPKIPEPFVKLVPR